MIPLADSLLEGSAVQQDMTLWRPKRCKTVEPWRKSPGESSRNSAGNSSAQLISTSLDEAFASAAGCSERLRSTIDHDGRTLATTGANASVKSLREASVDHDGRTLATTGTNASVASRSYASHLSSYACFGRTTIVSSLNFVMMFRICCLLLETFRTGFKSSESHINPVSKSSESHLNPRYMHV
jgi:hypothetical protein